MLTFFYVSFGVGVGYALISFILGEIVGAIDFDTDIDLSGAASPLKPVVFAVFLTVFGGIGIITLKNLGFLLSLSLAGISGLAAAYCFYIFVIVPLYKMQNTSAIEKQSLIGSSAKVTESIPQGKYGKITYYANYNTYSAPAKSEDGLSIQRHQEVEIIHIERNTFFVRSK